MIGGNRPGFGNDTNINIGNNVNVGNQIGNQVGNRWTNRPNWDVDPGFSRPAWGIGGGGGWHDHWHNNCINHHHNWYNGCWHGYWGSNWYSPVAWGAVGWGLGAMTSGWGYNTAYYNPYYAEPAVAQAMPYDYSQPVVINNYVSSDAEGGEAQAQAEAASAPGMANFDEGLAKFKSGDYSGALGDFNAALRELPSDPVVHEVRCLALFANGDYSAAAAGLNSLLSAAPGMDWTTMSGLYGNASDYSDQLQRLEQFCQANPSDSGAHFVLAYHYLVTGAKDEAIDALRVVVTNQPRDATAKRMLDALAPAAVAETPTPPAAAPTENGGETDLVGNWTSRAGDTEIELSISEESQFVWAAKSPGQDEVKLSGTISGSADGISLETADQGAMAGTVKSLGPDAWQFAISGAPASDPGLKFTRSN